MKSNVRELKNERNFWIFLRSTAKQLLWCMSEISTWLIMMTWERGGLLALKTKSNLMSGLHKMTYLKALIVYPNKSHTNKFKGTKRKLIRHEIYFMKKDAWAQSISLTYHSPLFTESAHHALISDLRALCIHWMMT